MASSFGDTTSQPALTAVVLHGVLASRVAKAAAKAVATQDAMLPVDALSARLHKTHHTLEHALAKHYAHHTHNARRLVSGAALRRNTTGTFSASETVSARTSATSKAVKVTETQVAAVLQPSAKGGAELRRMLTKSAAIDTQLTRQMVTTELPASEAERRTPRVAVVFIGEVRTYGAAQQSLSAAVGEGADVFFRVVHDPTSSADARAIAAMRAAPHRAAEFEDLNSSAARIDRSAAFARLRATEAGNGGDSTSARWHCSEDDVVCGDFSESTVRNAMAARFNVMRGVALASATDTYDLIAALRTDLVCNCTFPWATMWAQVEAQEAVQAEARELLFVPQTSRRGSDDHSDMGNGLADHIAIGTPSAMHKCKSPRDRVP